MIRSRRTLLSSAVAGTMFMSFALGGAALAEKYEANMYVAGMGGHFADAKVIIDPSKETPITITTLNKLDIGDGATHPTHDARIDAKDRNILYWSTYKLDKDAGGVTHIGKSDLSTGKVLKDMEVKTPENVINTAKMYCGSGQTDLSYMPVTMSKPGYLTVADKNTMEVKHQIFFEGTDADPGVPYKYIHGTTSPDGSEYFLTFNESDAPATSKDYGNTVGKMHMVVLDSKALEQGKIKVLRKGIATGNKKSTVSFRQYYSPDGKYIANATGDILYIIDAKTLKVLDAETAQPLDQFHDGMFTPDSKYVIVTSRAKRIKPGVTPKDPKKPADTEFLMDGTLMVYDMKAGAFTGKATSACLSCHDEELGTGEDAVHAILCGLDANWK
ncbi:MAG: hypothetical protein K9K37_09975 [Desulfocapsa sp.]|nr:hypothetical protein [Desulfocapsa sp.]